MEIHCTLKERQDHNQVGLVPGVEAGSTLGHVFLDFIYYHSCEMLNE
jgi:hypothetical protein